MYINTNIVRALMTLRRIDATTLANIATLSTQTLEQWLDATTGSENVIPFDTQLEILRVLGINGETPRNDVVHYWYLHETLFSSSAKNYWALSVLTNAFGAAEAVYFAKDTDPLASLSSKAHFGLQFSTFKAVLEVTSHPLRNVGFDPALIHGVTWAEGNFSVLVDPPRFLKLGPGAMTPAVYDSEVSVGKELLAWERLSLLARDKRVGTEQIEQLLLAVQEGLKTPRLTENRQTATPPATNRNASEPRRQAQPQASRPEAALDVDSAPTEADVPARTGPRHRSRHGRTQWSRGEGT